MSHKNAPRPRSVSLRSTRAFSPRLGRGRAERTKIDFVPFVANVFEMASHIPAKNEVCGRKRSPTHYLCLPVRVRRRVLISKGLNLRPSRAPFSGRGLMSRSIRSHSETNRGLCPNAMDASVERP